jgi:hypothetical protein
METSTGILKRVLTGKGSFFLASRIAVVGLLFLFFSTPVLAGKKYSAASGNWTTGSTWIGGVVPTNNDTVFVLKQHTVTVNSNVNLSGSYVFLIVIGTLDMTNNGKLSFNVSSKVIIETGGRILGNGSSDTISIGPGAAEYTGAQGTLTGPSNISNNDPGTSGEGTGGFYGGIGVASCTITSSNGYTVHALVWARKILVETNPCTWGYNYDVRMDYSIQFTGTNIPASLHTLQGNINCGSSSMFFDLPNAGGTGTVDSQGNAWRGVSDCATATPTSLNCLNAGVQIEGPGLSYQTCATPLPIKLLSFEGDACENGICLRWATGSEENFDKFIVEHSTDGLHYDSVGFVSGTGDSKVRVDYQFKDLYPTLGKNYYRLKSLDNDLTFEYSHVIAIEFEASKSLVIFPNPIQHSTVKVRTNFQPAKGDKVEIFDNVGLKISEFEITDEENLFGINLPVRPGSYLLRYSSETYSQIVRFTSK